MNTKQLILLIQVGFDDLRLSQINQKYDNNSNLQFIRVIYNYLMKIILRTALPFIIPVRGSSILGKTLPKIDERPASFNLIFHIVVSNIFENNLEHNGDMAYRRRKTKESNTIEIDKEEISQAGIRSHIISALIIAFDVQFIPKDFALKLSEEIRSQFTKKEGHMLWMDEKEDLQIDMNYLWAVLVAKFVQVDKLTSILKTIQDIGIMQMNLAPQITATEDMAINPNLTKRIGEYQGSQDSPIDTTETRLEKPDKTNDEKIKCENITMQQIEQQYWEYCSGLQFQPPHYQNNQQTIYNSIILSSEDRTTQYDQIQAWSLGYNYQESKNQQRRANKYNEFGMEGNKKFKKQQDYCELSFNTTKEEPTVFGVTNEQMSLHNQECYEINQFSLYNSGKSIICPPSLFPVCNTQLKKDREDKSTQQEQSVPKSDSKSIQTDISLSPDQPLMSINWPSDHAQYELGTTRQTTLIATQAEEKQQHKENSSK